MAELVYNRKNAVTASLSRTRWQDQDAVAKVLSDVNHVDTPAEWRASNDPQDWNYWRRECAVYASDLNRYMRDARVRTPDCFYQEIETRQITLILEDVGVRTGHALDMEDYARIVHAWGHAQGLLSQSNILAEEWTSRQFLRRYTASKPVDYWLLESDEVWRLPMIRDQWHDTLQEGLLYLYHHRQALLDLLENQPRVPSHLDFWPNNVLLDDKDWIVPIDWGFFGAGAWGEDLGNYIPDAVFDGFVSAQTMREAEDVLINAYLSGVQAAGIDLDMTACRQNVYASAVKYVWLAPLLLERALNEQFSEYGGGELKDPRPQYRERGQMLLRLCEWAQMALR